MGLSSWIPLLCLQVAAAARSTLRLPCGTLGCSAELDYEADEAAQSLWLRLRVMVPPGAKPPGWLAIGFSPLGSMASGDYIFGYSGCVRALSNVHDGLPPGEPAPFTLNGSSFEIVGRNMTLEAVRPFRSGIPEHVTLQKGTLTNVLYAAGSSEAAPSSGNCGAWLTLLNHHDLASAGLTNHVTVDLFDRPPAAPGAAAFGGMQLGCCASLQWRVQGTSVALRLDAIVANGTTPGWLGLGFSPGGTMAAGDFIVGYAGADRPCVRALSSSREGRPPAEPQPFELANASFTISGRTMTLSATRPLKSVVQGHVELGLGAVNVLYAAGSRMVVPWGCGNALNLLNHHDLGYLVGAAVVGIASDAPTAPPVPPPAGPQWQCSVCKHVYNSSTDAVLGCSKASPPCQAAAGTAFPDLPTAWVCPVCGAPKSAYIRTVDDASGRELWVHEHDGVDEH